MSPQFNDLLFECKKGKNAKNKQKHVVCIIMYQKINYVLLLLSYIKMLKFIPFFCTLLQLLQCLCLLVFHHLLRFLRNGSPPPLLRICYYGNVILQNVHGTDSIEAHYIYSVSSQWETNKTFPMSRLVPVRLALQTLYERKREKHWARESTATD